MSAETDARETETDRLAARLARMAPEAPSRRKGVHPYALAGITAVAGVGLGAWLVIAAPEAPAAAPALETSAVDGFPDVGPGTDGFRPVAAPAPTPTLMTAPITVPDGSATEALRTEIDRLRTELAELQAAPAPTPDAGALASLQAQIDALGAEARTREASLAELERENIRLQTALETQDLIAGDPPDAAARAREAELARRRQEAEALRDAQVRSDMVALRATGGHTGTSSAVAAGDAAPAGTSATGAEAFRRAGATPAGVRRAEIIADPAHTVMQGTLIEAALETAISSSLAGNVAALVSHDVWSFDMSRVLIPRGSRLYGRYDSDLGPGQRRILIAWDRIVTTDGQSVRLAAYGTDRIGRSGLPGKVRTHFLQRFGTAALISVIGAVPVLAAARYDGNDLAANTAENVGSDLGGAVEDVMADTLRIPQTISVDQGAVVMVRVDTDIAFN